MENKSKELEVAIEAAKEAGKILEKYFETEILKKFKEDDSIVTKADGETEDIIKKTILNSFPGHSILAEETGHTKNGKEYTWHIDPLDGTRNFSNAIPLFATSIALEHAGELQLGVIYNPITNSMFYAEKSKGAYWNDKKILVSKDNATRAIFASGKSRKPEDRQLCRDLIYEMPGKFPGMTVRDIGCCALDLAYIAYGAFEVCVEIGLHSYDFAAGVLLVQEAGGKITKLDGSAWKFPDNHFIASNGVFHDKLVAEVQRQKKKLGMK